jgi:ASCH domain
MTVHSVIRIDTVDVAPAIFRAGKDVENRKQRTRHRGRLWIHAGLFKRRDAHDLWAAEAGLWVPPEPLPRGVILGSVELVDCVEDSDSPWAIPGHYHWVLRSPRLLVRSVPAVGSLSFVWRRPSQGACVRARRARASYR